MSPNTKSDAQSMWQQAFARAERGLPAFWFAAEPDDAATHEAAGEPADATDEDWATEALFDYYNS